MTVTTAAQTSIPGLLASEPRPLPFGTDLEIRAFLLQRDAGNVLVYSVPDLDVSEFGDAGPIARAYLSHGHEAGQGTDLPGVPLFVHEADRAMTQNRHIRGSFSQRHTLDGDFEAIPIPGHTPGATAYLWDTGEHRLLFTGDSIYLRRGEWAAAVLGSSDRASYIDSLERLRQVEFDVLVPWLAVEGQPILDVTTPAEARRRIEAIIERLRAGEDR